MSYNKRVWKSGDRITKEALNNMENGIEAAHQNSGGTGSVAIVDNLNSDSSTSALSAKQGKELNNKMPAKSIVEGGKIYLAKEDGTKIDSGTELPAGGSTIEVVNNLESDSTTAALSAAQGKALNTQYKDNVKQNINKDNLEDSIDSLISQNSYSSESTYINDFDEAITSYTTSSGRGKILYNPITKNCKITQVKFISRMAGSIPIVILKNNGSGSFVLVNKIDITCKSGLNEIKVNIDVEKGQYIGVWDKAGLIGITTTIKNKYYVTLTEPLATGTEYKELADGYIMFSYKIATGSKEVKFIDLPKKINELENITGLDTQGYINSFDDITNKHDSSANFTRIISPEFPANGTIKRIKLDVQNSGSVKILTFKKDNNNFIQTSSKTLNVGVGLNEINVNIPAKKGEYLGYYSQYVKITTSTDRKHTYYTTSGDTKLDISTEFVKRTDSLMFLAYMYDNLINSKQCDYENFGKFNTAYNLKNSYGVRPLYIQTPYPGVLNQPYHPCVLYFDTAWNGYKYWMSESPFPKGASPYRDRYENPCIHCSNDGVNWTTPIGLVNPIDDLTATDITNKDYMSDPHIIYRQDLNRIECWYRITRATDSNHTYILRKYSTDGVNWSERETIYDCIDNGTNEMIRSQGVIWEDNKYKFLYTDRSEKVKYGEWDGSSNWTFSACTLSDNKSVWHLDFGKNPTDNSYYMIAYSKKDSDVKYYKSADKLTWTYVKTLLTTGDDSTFWNSTLYRSCATYNGKEWLLYFTAEKDKRLAILGLMKGKTLDTLEVVDGGNNIESIICNSDLIVNGEIVLNGIKLGYDGNNLYFQKEDGTRLIIAN